MATKEPKKRGRPPKPKLTEAERKAVALASANGRDAISTVIADFNQTPAPHNRNVTDAHMETVLARVAAGETVKGVCADLGISAALVRQRVYDAPEVYGERLHQARRLNADQSFEEMIEVARDPSLEVGRARLIVEVLEKMAKVNNRATYGDKVQVDQRQIVINYDPEKHGGFI
ncbi:hypothetical protein [Brevundimonas sp. NPDC058933]|uniref:terminase small subunit-like protein n=1 Tax=Brevundimonas sp. NPDC058933 TaxID=3346673 RepID=UPI003BEF43C4